MANKREEKGEKQREKRRLKFQSRVSGFYFCNLDIILMNYQAVLGAAAARRKKKKRSGHGGSREQNHAMATFGSPKIYVLDVYYPSVYEYVY